MPTSVLCANSWCNFSTCTEPPSSPAAIYITTTSLANPVASKGSVWRRWKHSMCVGKVVILAYLPHTSWVPISYTVTHESALPTHSRPVPSSGQRAVMATFNWERCPLADIIAHFALSSFSMPLCSSSSKTLLLSRCAMCVTNSSVSASHSSTCPSLPPVTIISRGFLTYTMQSMASLWCMPKLFSSCCVASISRDAYVRLLKLLPSSDAIR
mmetsp:Transcript_6690/g.14838  ORF Transcript_6690/g.14838 Transcript_6690/m.14838 type:complete len:212 (-) Transcript_6690:474-1109(-)